MLLHHKRDYFLKDTSEVKVKAVKNIKRLESVFFLIMHFNCTFLYVCVY